jgi:beta-lactamase superfamily II metal-dependent hydrolase
MLFSLDVMRAKKGDCLIVHYGSEDDPKLLMIDGGPAGVYQKHLRPRLQQIMTARDLTAPLEVEMLMVSHVDDDHIHGVLDLVSELKNADEAQVPRFIRISNVWHNSFENVIGAVPEQLKNALETKSATASTAGELPDFTLDIDENAETIESSLKVLSSVTQGQQLGKDVKSVLEAIPNIYFDEQLVVADENTEALDMENGLFFTVIGPMLPELKELWKAQQKWLEDLAAEGKTAEDVLSAYMDKSVPNLSSLVVLAEVEGKKMLLTGDARGDKIIAGLELVGLLEDGRIEVDVLKAPHHGSSNNLEKDFFEKVIAHHYVFSGNGEHGNPERESLEWLWDARGDADYVVHLTYPIAEIDAARKAEWQKHQRAEKNRQEKAKLKGKPGKDPRADWSDEEHSLGALFAANPKFAEKLSTINDDNERHIINLLEAVEF